jgi:hypothetical protein
MSDNVPKGHATEPRRDAAGKPLFFETAPVREWMESFLGAMPGGVQGLPEDRPCDVRAERSSTCCRG